MPVKKRIFLITALLYILYTIFPLFADTFSIPVWLPSIASFFIMFVLFPRAFSNKTFAWLLAYITILFLYLLVGHPLTIGIGSVADNKKILIEIAYVLPSVSVFGILVFLKDEVLNQKLFKWSIVLLFVSFLVAVPLMLKYNSLREAMNLEKRGDLTIPGLPSYSLMHAYTLILPVFCYSVKVIDKNKRVYAFLGLAAICFVIYDTFVTTSLLMMILILLFTLFHYERNSALSRMILIWIVLLTFVLYEAGFFIAVIDSILPVFKDTAVEPKLIDIRSSMIQGALIGDSITVRQDYHGRSWAAFFQNPLFGGSIAGGHSSLIDRFGGMGLLVGIPFLMILVSFIKKMSSIYRTQKARSFFWIGVIVAFVYLYNKGNWGCESWLSLMVLMPMSLWAIESSSRELCES